MSPVKEVQMHPEYSSHLMIVPKGTMIGGQITPENGVFMTEKVFQMFCEELIKAGQRGNRKEAFRQVEG